MEIFQQIIHNSILISGAIAWVVAQIAKTITHAVVYKTLDPKRLLGDGGMPSSHSATVTAMAIACGIEAGFDTPIFAVATIFALVVMHDATGVRRETGKQAKIINDLVKQVYEEDMTPDEILKEFVGHTPLQVCVGAVLGGVVALLICL